MLYLLPDQIRIAPNRIRRKFDDAYIGELAGSISTKGLLNAITVRRIDADTYELVAGENRLRACTNLIDLEVPFRHGAREVPKAHVACELIDDLPEDLRLEAELEENTHRRDLTWQEQVEGRRRLFELRKKQAEARGETYAPVKLADELKRAGVPGTSKDAVTRDLRLARHLSDPEVAGAKTEGEALKIVKRKTLSTLLAAIGEVVEAETSEGNSLLVGDSLEVLGNLPAGTFSIVLTDPPYGVEIDSAGSQVENAHHYEDGEEVLNDILDIVPAELTRVTTPSAHLYWFCDILWFPTIKAAFVGNGWEVWPRPIIWNKNGKGIAPDTQFGPRYTYECILFARKGPRPTMRLAADVITFSANAEHQQAEKPVEVLLELLSRSAQPGDKILDPFCGSGSIFVAAKQAKCTATGIEKDEERAKLARTRLNGEKI